MIRSTTSLTGALSPVLLLALIAGTVRTASCAAALPQSIVFKLKQDTAFEDLRSQGEWRVAEGQALSVGPALPVPAEGFHGLERIFRTQEDPAKWLALLQADPRVEWAEIPPPRQTSVIPDDPDYDELWALPRVEAPAAWDQHQAQGDVLVAVVDTGCDTDHPDLAANLYTNPAEAQGTPGVDDDGNGYVDDLHGWDVRDGDADVNPEGGDSSHGTHVCGTAACVTDNGAGVACIAWNPRLLPVRAGHASSITAGIEGIYYATVTGADVINCSWGGDSYSYYEQNVIQAALASGSLVVAAAGNNGSSQPHYPAAYDGVLSVASFSATDTKVSSSQYGCWVDLGAPGSSIWSTANNGSYTFKSGTSMATPQVSSLAALVKSAFPAFGPDAVREQVIFTCDNVDAQNPIYAGLLGRGRINARRALQESPSALFRLGESISEPSGNGIIDPGEEFGVVLQLRQQLGSSSNVSVSLSCEDGRISILDGSASFGSGTPGSLLDNAADPFALQASAAIPNGTRVELVYTITADGGFLHRQCGQVVIAPIHATHDNSNLRLTVSGHGALGYYDFESNQARGEGFRWPADGPNHLYVGSLLVGQPAQDRVVDVASYLSGNAPDFEPLPGSTITLSENGSQQFISASFNDQGMAVPLGLEIDLLSRSIDEPGLEDVVVLDYELRNVSGSTLNGLLGGLWMDYDIEGSWGNDEGGWDAGRGLGYMTESGGPACGLLLLNEEAGAFRLCEWGEWSGGGLSDEELSSYLLSGFSQTSSSGADDWQACLATTMENLADGSSRRVVFALLGAGDLSALQLRADTIREWFETSVRPGNPERPGPHFRLLGVHPNPFNPVTWVELQLERAATVEWALYDLLGRRLAVGGRDALAAGTHRLRIDGSGLASGSYWLVLNSGAHSLQQGITLIK